MQLYFIRHGQSANNARWDETGSDDGRSEDPDLTDIGHQQARALGEFLAVGNPNIVRHKRDAQNVGGFHFTHLYSSLMIRAIKTAEYVAKAKAMPIIAWQDIHEGGGIYTDNADGTRQGLPGNSRRYFQTNHPTLQLADDLDEHGWWRSKPFEEYPQRVERARRVLAQLIAKHGDTEDSVVMVSHGEHFVRLMKCILGMSQETHTNIWLAMNNCAIARVDFNFNNELALVYLNRCEYLPRHLIT